MKSVRWCIALLLLGGVATASASVKCFPERIKSVQVARGGDLFYTTVSGVRRKLTHLSQYEATAMLEMIKDSMGSNQIIQVAYPNGYDCKKPDLDAHADWVMMQDPSVQ